ncbi:replication initiator protein A [Planctomyces sp. SH-PL62]|uniref:replication initiator protein A n=1 Tax=Planctomyces sp. SH-PL62 TaxID=1636152 RepID=UPI00078E082C|nr:replication initiator protein A [Planctomyces sp. SH-PL62]AMV40961.1 Replication initiator protein A [Planctomyces sp. SH-PL62]
MGTYEASTATSAAFAAPPDLSRNREGRDEMNLAEYPIALLSDRAPNKLKTVVYHDKDETLTITGSDLLGLPTALDVDVIIGLLHLTKVKSNFQSTQVHFTRYELIRLLGWPDRGYYYTRLTESLNRWVGVTLIYKKAWWDNETRTKGNYSFHILESATVIEQEQRRGCQARQIPLPLSSVRWSAEFFKSFQANNLKKLDLGLYFSLKSAISKQLYRFLDKRFYKRTEWTFDLRTLACEHVGMSRNYECWRLKQKIQPAIDELTAVGFLKPMDADARFKRVGSGQWTITLVRAKSAARGIVEGSPEDVPEAPELEPNPLEAELVARGISPKVARELVAGYPESRIQLQIEQVDWVKKKGRRKIVDLGAYLAQAVRDDYARPDGFVSKAEKAERQKSELERRRREQAEARRKQELARRREKERAMVQLYWTELSADEREAFRAEALANADPDQLKVYREVESKRGPFAEAMWGFIRDRHVRSKLGLPAEENAE